MTHLRKMMLEELERRNYAQTTYFLLMLMHLRDGLTSINALSRQRNCQIAGPRARSFNSIVPC